MSQEKRKRKRFGNRLAGQHVRLGRYRAHQKARSQRHNQAVYRRARQQETRHGHHRVHLGEHGASEVQQQFQRIRQDPQADNRVPLHHRRLRLPAQGQHRIDRRT